MENGEKAVSVEPTGDLQPEEGQAAEVVPRTEETGVRSEEGGEGRADGVREDGGKERADGPSVVETAAPSDAVKDGDSPTAYHPLVGYFIQY